MKYKSMSVSLIFFMKIFFGVILSISVAFSDDNENDGHNNNDSGKILVVDNTPVNGKSCENTTPYSTIQDAVNDAGDGDTIKICKGSYNESVHIYGKKDITLTNGSDAPSRDDINWYATTTVLTVGSTNGDNKSDNLKIKNLSMHLTSNSANERVIRLLKGKDFTIDNVKLVSDGGSAIYGESGNFDGKNTFTNLAITSKGSGIRINKGEKQIFENINMTLNGNSGNDIGIYLGDNVKDKDHQFKNLTFSVKNQPAILIKNGKDMKFDTIKVNATDYSDNTDAISTQDNVSGDAKLEFNNIDIEINAGTGLDIHKAKDTKYTDITIKGSSNEAILIHNNVTGKPEFKNINIKANANYGIYIQKGKDVSIEDANISGITANGFIIRLDSNVEGKHKFKNIIATTDAEGIYVNKGKDVTFDTVKITGTNSSANDYGIKTDENVNNGGTISVKNCDINVSGYALWVQKGKPDIDSSKFISRGDKVVYFTSNTKDVKMKNSCSYKESSSGNAYAFYIDNGKKNADIKNNCFFGTPLGNLASANKTGNNIRKNYWDGLSASSYNYNHIVDNSPLSSCPNVCNSSESSTSQEGDEGYNFDAWDTFRDINDRNISTKIVNQNFNLTIASLDKNGTKYQDFNGTVCVTLGTATSKLLFNNQNKMNTTIKISKAIKDAKVHLSWKKNIDENCPLSSEDNSTNSTDNFAIRPKEFKITQIDTNIYAGDNFRLKFEALDGSSSDTTGYNESKDSSFKIDANITKSGCYNGVLNVVNFSFANGLKSIADANYSDVGDVNVTIREKLGNEFAAVDADDTNETDRLIAPFSKIITVKPYELNVTNVKFDTSTGNNWIYMSDVNSLSQGVKSTVQANDKLHNIVKNFTKLCYAKDINVSNTFYVNNSNNQVKLTYNVISGSMINTSKNIADINKTLTLPKSIFTSSKADVNYRFNIDKDYKKPYNPIVIGLRGVNIISMGLAKINNNASSNINTTFYYGRVKTKDIDTNKKSVKHSLNIEVYSTSNLLNFHENSLNWYRMKDDSVTKIVDFLPKKDFTMSIAKSGFNDINSTQSIANGLVSFTITNSWIKADNSYIHIKIPKYLWYSRYNPYDDSASSNCGRHPCFKYNYLLGNNQKSIKSGNFSGTSTGGNYDASKISKKGVKTYR